MYKTDLKDPLKEKITDEEVLEEKKIRIDTNLVFWIYRKTRLLLWIILVTFVYVHLTKQDAMQCLNGENLKDDVTFSMYCWTMGTHIVYEKINATIGVEVPHPGISKMEESSTILNQKSYQWMYAYLAFLYFTIIFSWNTWLTGSEGCRIAHLVGRLDVTIVHDEKELTIYKKEILTYLRINLYQHNFFAVKYIALELFNLLNVIFQTWLINLLMNGEFVTYGSDVLKLWMEDPDLKVNPFDKCFPKVSTCHVHLIGPSGSKYFHEGLCVLPYNNFHDKVFALLWFWFAFLITISLLGFIYRLLTIFVPGFRRWLLQCRTVHCKPDTVSIVCRNCCYGDWLLIFTLRNCADGWVTDEVLNEYAVKLKKIEMSI